MATTDAFLNGVNTIVEGFAPIQDAKEFWGQKASQLADSAKNTISKAFNAADHAVFSAAWGLAENREDAAKKHRDSAQKNVNDMLNSENSFFKRLSAGASLLQHQTAADLNEHLASTQRRLRDENLFSGKGMFGVAAGVSRGLGVVTSKENSILDRATKHALESSAADETFKQFSQRNAARAFFTGLTTVEKGRRAVTTALKDYISDPLSRAVDSAVRKSNNEVALGEKVTTAMSKPHYGLSEKPAGFKEASHFLRDALGETTGSLSNQQSNKQEQHQQTRKR